MGMRHKERVWEINKQNRDLVTFTGYKDTNPVTIEITDFQSKNRLQGKNTSQPMRKN